MKYNLILSLIVIFILASCSSVKQTTRNKKDINKTPEVIEVTTGTASADNDNPKATKSVPVLYDIVIPENVKVDEEFEAVIQFVTNGDWYIYAPTGTNKKHGMIETNINFNLPEGIEKIGNLRIPPPRPKGMYKIYAGQNIQFRQKFKATTKGSKKITAKVIYQTCNKQICLPPKTKNHSYTINIK